MKKLFVLFISVVLLFSVTGCGSVTNTKGEPSQEQAYNVINESHSGATFIEKVKSKAGEEDIWTFYYEKSSPQKYATTYTTYAIEFHYNQEAKQWDYSPAKEVEVRNEWDIEGTWYPVINEYRTWYSSCVMTVGKIENDQVHITFEKDGKMCFDETVPFNNKGGASFRAKTSSSSWDDVSMYIMPHTVEAAQKGTRVGCGFEKAD